MFGNHLQKSTQLLCRKIQASEGEKFYLWEEVNVLPFDEMILSWCGSRPEKGNYLMRISLFIDEKWTTYLNYAYWGTNDQHTFSGTSICGSWKTFQDVVEILDGRKATGFRVLIELEGGATWVKMRELHASIIDGKALKIARNVLISESIALDVSGLSQLILTENLSMRVCSPTSTTAVINYLTSTFRPVLPFAENVRDHVFDIFGNWILNTAEASHILGSKWDCFVAHLTTFDQIFKQLKKKYPVIVSIKGHLPGSLFPYDSGHLIVVRGYDALEKKVLCMDPAFPSNLQTCVAYPLDDFLTAWNKRKGIAYIFSKNTEG